MMPDEFLTCVIEIAQRAGQKIMAVYESRAPIEIENKADQSPLTIADRLSHNFICEQLEKLAPEIPILSEESNSYDQKKAAKTDKFWLVDPLDGTKEFIDRNGEFTVNIALIDKNDVILGVVYVPTTQACYFASINAGTYKQISDQRPEKLNVSNSYDPSTRIKVATSRRHGLETMQAFLNKIGPSECIEMGSSLKICALAEGIVDIYPRLGPTKEWDTAAAQCVLEQAGGQLLIQSQKQLKYNKKELLNPNFLAIRRGKKEWVNYLSESSST